MSDIKGQLIKDSYNYVLQADIVTGVVYRIGGAVPTNPIFQSGLTINQSFNYSDGSQQNGYVLTSDGSGNATWKAISAATPSSGVTSITSTNNITGTSTTGAVTIGLSNDITVNSINATTYYNLPSQVTGSDTWIQFNDGGVFGSDLTLTYDKINLVFKGGSNNPTIDPGVTESFFIGGHDNSILGESTHGGIAGSYESTINNSNNCTILGGNNNVIQDTSLSSVIVGGDGTKGSNIIRSSDSAIIVGGTDNNIVGSQFSSIVGGTGNSISSHDNSVVIGGSGIGALASNFVYVPSLNINTTPVNDNTLSQVLVRDSSGDIKYRDVSTIGGSGTFTGGTVTGPTIFTAGVTANTISATTYYNLPIDIRVTGGTYSAGTATFTNNTGGTFTVTGFSTSTSSTGAYLPLSGGTVTGGTIFTSGLTANTISLDSVPSLMTATATTVTTGTNNIYSVPTNTYNSFHIDYNISGSSGLRAGSVVGIWDGSNVDYTDTSTNDIGNTTPVSFLVALSGGNAILQASVTTSTWRIKTIIRTI